MLLTSTRGPIVWSLWLLDILHSLHFNGSIITFTSKELRTTMPSSELEFQDVYGALMSGSAAGVGAGPDRYVQEDALLLLMAVLSDLIYLRGSLGHVVRVRPSPSTQTAQANPFVSLAAPAELARMEKTLDLALKTWKERYFELMTPEVKAFYHYCTIYRSCDQLLLQTAVAEDTANGHCVISDRIHSVPDEAVRAAWIVLSNVSEWSQEGLSKAVCPIWLPIMLYHAAIIVWAQHDFSQGQDADGVYSGARMLLPFQIELGFMHWPCCKDMMAILGRLMAPSRSSN